MVLRGGNVTQAGFGSCVNWIYDPAPPPPRRAPLHSRNSHVSIPNDRRKNEVSAIATRGSSPAPLSSVPPKKRRMRRRRQARRAANRNAEISSAAPPTQDARWANQCAAVPAGATQPLPENSDPTSARRTEVYPPSWIVSDSLANENSPFQIGLESSRIPGLYKPAVPDQQQDTHARTFRANSSGSGTSSPPYLLPYTKLTGSNPPTLMLEELRLFISQFPTSWNKSSNILHVFLIVMTIQQTLLTYSLLLTLRTILTLSPLL